METETIATLGFLISLISAVIALMSAFFARKSFEESRNSTYIQIFDIIKRHHSPEITALRKIVLTTLDSKCKEAAKLNKCLLDYAPETHEKASELANYYESLGMFLQGGWHYFPLQVKATFMEMLHNSVTNTWSLFSEHKAIIYTGKSPDWAGSYRWLYNECQEYRADKELTS